MNASESNLGSNIGGVTASVMGSTINIVLDLGMLLSSFLSTRGLLVGNSNNRPTANGPLVETTSGGGLGDLRRVGEALERSRAVQQEENCSPNTSIGSGKSFFFLRTGKVFRVCKI